MIDFNNLRIKARINTGFGALIVIGLGVAAFGGWQLAKIGGQVEHLSAVAENAARNLQVSRLAEAMRRASLRFKTLGDESQIKEFNDAQAQVSELLATAAKATSSNERRVLYNDVAAKVGEVRQNFDKLVQLGARMKANRTKLFSGGDEVAAATAKLVEAARATGDQELTARAGDVETSVLLVRIANWRFLATSDAKGPANFKTNVDKAGAAIAALEKTTGGERVAAQTAPIKAAVKDYAASFDDLAAAMLQADDLFENVIRATNIKINEQQEVARQSLVADLNDTKTATAEVIASTTMTQEILAGLGLLLGLALAYFIGRGIAVPVVEVAQAMGRLAQGDDSVDIAVSGRRDEIGEMHKALAELKAAVTAAFRTGQMVETMPTNVMTCSLPNLEISYMNAGTRALLKKLEAQGLLPCKVDEMQGRSIDMFHKNPSHQRRILADPSNLPHRAQIKVGAETLALNISAVRDRAGTYIGPMLVWNVVTAQMNLADEVNGVVDRVASGSSQLEASAQAMSSTAQETNSQAAAVAAASEQTSTNVQTVATAAEELSGSIREIGRQVTSAAKAAGDAVSQTERTNGTVQGLADAAQKIGAVVELINGIASQTNLLALNATIEAARAGDAGKGFAVVASEVKSLANQTAKATEEIAGQIAAMQSVTQEAVAAIRGIGAAVSGISEIATSIASAVEEQEAATQEIARNVQQAAAGTQEVSSNIVGVTQAASQTGTAAGQVLLVSGELSQQALALREKIEKFIKDSKAA